MIGPEADRQAHQRAAPVIEISPRRGRVPIDISGLWQYRELLYFLTWRDLKVRYRQTVLGAGWAVIQPLVTMLVFSVIFGRLAGIPSDGAPYPIFAFAALVPWTFFATGVTQAANSLVGSQNLLKKVYFPRLVIPISAVVAGFVDLAIAGIVLLALMLGFGIVPGLASVFDRSVSGAGIRHGARCRRVALGTQRPVPRCALYRAVPSSGLAVRDPRCLPEQPARRTVAHVVRAQPNGRRRRGHTMGAPGHGDRARSADRWSPARSPCSSSCPESAYFRHVEGTFADVV